MNLKNLGMAGKFILVTVLLLVGLIFLFHGLGFAYLSFLFSVVPVAYLFYRLKRHEHDNKLKFCFDIVAYIFVLAMIFVSIFPNILFFPDFLEKCNIPTVELYSSLEDGNIQQKTVEHYSNLENRNIPNWKMTIYRLSNNIQRAEFNSKYFSDKPFLQGFLLKFPVTSMIGIPFSFYNTYSYFVFVFNLIFPFAGICILIIFPVVKVLSVLKEKVKV